MLKVRESHISIFYSPDFFFEGWGGGGGERGERLSSKKGRTCTGVLVGNFKENPYYQDPVWWAPVARNVFTRH